MNHKIVYQLDSEGYFVGETEADESPLEPGVYLVPGGCVENPPPKIKKEGQVQRFVKDRWRLEDAPKNVQDPVSGEVEDRAELTADQVMAMRKQAYSLESDPLKNEAEYDAIVGGGEPDYKQWLAKIEEIKARYPLPVDAQA